MKCPECSTVFTPRRIDQGYCSTACNRSAGQRELKRARVVYAALYHSRTGQGRKDGNLLNFIHREVAAWKAEDQAAGRGPPPYPRLLERDLGMQGRRALQLSTSGMHC